MKILVSILLFLSFNSLPAQACPTGPSGSLAYIRRDNNRCEGLRDEDISSIFSVVSFLSTNLSTYPDTLTIRVPGVGSNYPTISIQSYHENYYLLDKLNGTFSTSGYLFNLDTRAVLQKVEIPLASLQATAHITQDSSRLYFPVILGTASSQYQFIINSPQSTTFPVMEIRRDNQPVFSNPRTTPQQRSIRFFWTHSSASAGTYELYIEDSSGVSQSFRFAHDPSWFQN